MFVPTGLSSCCQAGPRSRRSGSQKGSPPPLQSDHLMPLRCRSWKFKTQSGATSCDRSPERLPSCLLSAALRVEGRQSAEATCFPRGARMDPAGRQVSGNRRTNTCKVRPLRREGGGGGRCRVPRLLQPQLGQRGCRNWRHGGRNKGFLPRSG